MKHFFKFDIMEFVFQNFLFSGVCLVRSLSRQEFVFQKFVFSGVCLSGVCLSGVCLSGVCHGAFSSTRLQDELLFYSMYIPYFPCRIRDVQLNAAFHQTVKPGLLKERFFLFRGRLATVMHNECRYLQVLNWLILFRVI